MRNEPSNVDQGPRPRTPTPPPPTPPIIAPISRRRRLLSGHSRDHNDDDDGEDNSDEDEEEDDDELVSAVYHLPPPSVLSEGGRCPRLPPAEPPPALEGLHLDLEQTDDMPPAILLSNHMVRSENQCLEQTQPLLHLKNPLFMVRFIDRVLSGMKLRETKEFDYLLVL